MKRTPIADTTRLVGKKVLLFGWVNTKRDHRKIVFIDLRDRTGIVQLVGDNALSQFNEEDVLAIEGKVVKRKPGLVNPDLPTGEVEIKVAKATRLAKAKPLPFSIKDEGRKLNEETRLKYRYLDLRRARMQKNLQTRHQLLQAFRGNLTKRGFWEIETPYISKSTPEGARDFLVPSRLQPGRFYALPQSPQQYKQLLMVAGIEKYFQIVRCFRDEDLRANRQFDFTQVDIEMSFVDQEEVLALTEALMIETVEAVGKKIWRKPFPRFTYAEAVKKFGADKFDLRKKKDSEALAFAWVVDFPLFEKTKTRRLSPVHHPFTSPNPKDLALLDTNPLKARAWQYDLICNGFEVAGGSIRITDPKIQEKVFSILGHSKKEIKQKFGHLLEAFEYGVPPHGGIAIGFDRVVAVVRGESSIREVIAFPVTSGGRTAVMEAPSRVSAKQLAELGIKVISSRAKK